MKKMLLAVSGMMSLMAEMAFAEAETPVIDQRQVNQDSGSSRGLRVGS